MNAEDRELNERLVRFVWPETRGINWLADGLEMVVLSGPTYMDADYDGPPFTHSLDAQAAHLWSRMFRCGYLIEMATVSDGSYFAKVSCCHRDNDWKHYSAQAATPSLACAKAIDAAIREAKS